MLIAIDYSPAQINPAGIGQYCLNLTNALIKNDKSNKYLIFSKKPITDLVKSPNYRNIVIEPAKFGPGKGLRYMNKLASIAKQEKVDLLLSMSDHALALMFPKTLVFIHDLAPIKYPEFFPLKSRTIYKLGAKLAAQKALKIITISKSVKEELIEYLKVPQSKVEIVSPSLNAKLLEIEPEFLDNIPSQYLLSVSTLEPRKNYETAIKGFKLIQKKFPNLKYIIAGKKGWYHEKIEQLIKQLGLTEDVILTGYASDAQVKGLLMKARAYIYLSHYEGFGMPPLEAMYFRVPLLLSDIPVFRESFDKLAHFTNPNDPESVATSLLELLNETTIKDNSRIIKKYSWDKSAKKLITIMNEING
ncbi:MAG TPA: glycosyltransferase family 1 protein [Candidatus Dojkabacteria bacterium]|nr:glycosyltransferase family 1 protein [Candidatus Dojkabacteria bacterium]